MRGKVVNLSEKVARHRRFFKEFCFKIAPQAENFKDVRYWNAFLERKFIISDPQILKKLVTTIEGPEQFFISPRCVTNPMHVVGEPLDFSNFYFFIFALKYFGFGLINKYFESRTTPHPPGGVWDKALRGQKTYNPLFLSTWALWYYTPGSTRRFTRFQSGR